MNSPVEGVQGKDAQFAVEVTVCTALEKELHQFGNVLAKNGYFLMTAVSIPLKSDKRNIPG